MSLIKKDLTASEFIKELITRARVRPLLAATDYYAFDENGIPVLRSKEGIDLRQVENLHVGRTVWVEQEWYENIPARGTLVYRPYDQSIHHVEYFDSESRDARTSDKLYFSVDNLTPLTNAEIESFKIK